MGAAFAPASGYFLYSRYTNGDPARGQDWVLQVLAFLFFEIITVIFIGSLLGIAWALFTPAWIEQRLRREFIHFTLLISGVGFVVTGIIFWSWFFGL
jgi:hypothetical protein